MDKISKYILIGGFFVIIFGFLIISVLTPDREISTVENRFLAEYPKVSKSSLVSGEFFKNFETYFTDQIYGRDQFVKAYTSGELVQNKINVNNVVIGEGDWLFSSPATKYRFERIDYTVDALDSLMEQKPAHTEVFMSLVPHKSNILFHEVPPYFDRNFGYENAQYLLQHLPESMHALDVQEQFVKDFSEKEISQFYFKTDHHWNIDGAFEAYKRTVRFMDQELEEFNERPIEEGTLSRVCVEGKDFIGSLNQQLYLPFSTKGENACYYEPPNVKVTVDHKEMDLSDIYSVGLEEQTIRYSNLYTGDYGILEYENDEVDNDLHLVVLKDSYANPVQPFFAQHFNKTTILDLRYYDEQTVLSYLKNNHVDILLMIYNNTNLFGEVYDKGLGL